MNLNYTIILLVLLIAIIALTFFLKRNAKDKNRLSKSLNAEETKPDTHNEEQV